MKPLQLETRTYFDIGNAINPNCLKVMPLEPKRKLQKFAVGTLQNLQYWENKKGEMILETKTENQAKEISRVVLSGNAQKYSMFFAAGQSIRGVTKKGKEFFKLDTSHTEIIKSLHVAGQYLWSAGDYILNCYESVENKIVDKYFYVCEDKINDLVIAPVSGQMAQNSVLACQDKNLRVLVDDKLLYSQKFDSACTALSLADEQTHRYCPIIGYGLRNGGIGCIELTRDEPVILWSLEGTQTNGSSVSVIKTCNFDGETTHGFIVARDDGSIEIYSYDHKSPYPILRFETKISESITGIDIGYISTPGKQEILITTYSGKIMSLVEKSSAIKQVNVVTDQVKATNKDIKITKTDQEKQLENDIKALEAQLEKETAELEKLQAQPQKKGAPKQPHGESIMFESFKVSYKMNLIPSEAAQVLFVDSQLPIDTLMIQSMQNIDIIEVKDNICKISAVKDKITNNALLATLKVQAEDSQVSRVEIKLRTSEGQTGNLLVYVIPKGSSTCQVLDIELKPLSLHERIDSIDYNAILKLGLSKISITGKFSLTDAHNWVSQCIPEVPQNVNQDDDATHNLYFRSTFIGTYIIIELKAGGITIQSDNLSVITILKDQLTQIANQKKLVLDMESTIVDSSWQSNLALLDPLISEQHLIAKKHQLIDGLKELQLQEDDMNFMSEEYKDILKNADHIRAQFKLQPRKLTYLWGIIADLYTDTAKIKGRHNVSGKMGTLKQILNNYNYDQLIQFFRQSCGRMFTNFNAGSYRGSSTYQQSYATSSGSQPIYSQSYGVQNKINAYQNDLAYLQAQSYRSKPLLYPLKDGNFDILYSEDGDGEILVETLTPEEGGQLRLITCVDISTLYKEKRSKAIEIAKEYSKLQHPHILSMTSEYELVDNNGTLIFYTEAPDHIAGWKSYCKKKFTTDEMLCIFRQLCEALGYIHEQGFIHRDVHPTRIHSTFGLAKFNMIGMPYNYKKLLKKDNFCGHVNYSAPELIQEKYVFSSKVDIWSLGCCLYYLCTKKDPFEGRNPQEIKQNIMMGRLEKYPSKFDHILKTLIHKCLEKDENKRLNAREMLEFQNNLEIETYGVIRSEEMLKSIMIEYNQIISNPLVHKYSQNEANYEYYNKGYGQEIRYKNPHFFSNVRYPYQSACPKQNIEEQTLEFDDGNTSLMQCRSPETMSHKDISKTNFHSLSTYSQTNVHQIFPPQKPDSPPSESSTQTGYLANKSNFQQDFKNYQQVHYGGNDSLISRFARTTITQHLQNNMDQFNEKQPQNFNMNMTNSSQQQALNKPNQETLNVAQPNRATTQPQKIILPKQEYVQRQIKQQQDKIDPPLPRIKFNESQQQNNATTQYLSYQRFNLTQSNLNMFNSQNSSQLNSNHIAIEQMDQVPTKIENINQSDQAPSSSFESIKHPKVQEQQNGDIPYSIFNTECIFATTPANNDSGTTDDINNSDIIKETTLHQEENPSSGESRNELNKDEIEGIVAQMVESSKRVKNQLHYYDGTKYVGEVMRHGRGIYYDQDGSIYDGEWYEDQRSGKGKILFPDGSVYDGQWESDKIHGKGVYLSSNGDRYEGNFNLGMKEGFGANYYRNGNTYQGQWRNDQLWGKGVFHFKSGNYYEGNFVNGNFEGTGLMFFVGIGTYKGFFRSGNLDGIGKFEYLNGSVYEGDWKENRKHGRGQLVEADGRTVHIGEWENDYKHGKGTFIQKGAYMIEGIWNKGSLVEMTKFTNYN